MLFLADELTDVSDMLNVLTEQNHTNVEIRNWLENNEYLLPLEDIDATEGHHDSSDNENPELNNTNQSVKNGEAVKSFNVSRKWAEHYMMFLYFKE
ncbi:hypothetical protein JTB14_036469 [Gonioctena quinquepunctata]|nr:hypothetical protein JTB14_036469 [Gonioctena quinquepunctata]